MTDWSTPQKTSPVLQTFPGSVTHLMPPMKDIPEEFKSGGSPWEVFQANWFFKGLKQTPKAKPGVDAETAYFHLHCIQGSFEPKHEHKKAAVAYLASLWFVSPEGAVYGD